MPFSMSSLTSAGYNKQALVAYKPFEVVWWVVYSKYDALYQLHYYGKVKDYRTNLKQQQHWIVWFQ